MNMKTMELLSKYFDRKHSELANLREEINDFKAKLNELKILEERLILIKEISEINTEIQNS